MLDVVLVLHVHPDNSDAAAALLAIGRERERLDVAGLRDRDDHLLVGDQVLHRYLALGVGDVGAAFVGVGAADLGQLLLDDTEDLGLVAEDLAQLLDPLDELGVLLLDLVRLERGEALETQVEDRLCLLGGELELLDEPLARSIGIARGADQLDHRVEVVDRDQQPLEDVGARLGPAQLVLGAANDDVALVVDVVADDLQQAERLGARRRPARPCLPRRCSAAGCACRAC